MADYPTGLALAEAVCVGNPQTRLAMWAYALWDSTVELYADRDGSVVATTATRLDGYGDPAHDTDHTVTARAYVHGTVVTVG